MRPRFGPSGARSLACGVILTSNVPVARTLLAGMIFALGVSLELIAIEVDIAEVARRIAIGLIVEMLRSGHAVQAACRDGPGLHLIAKLDDRDEAVAAGAVPLLGSRIRARAERCERTVGRRCEHHRRARLAVVELLHDGAVVALEA